MGNLIRRLRLEIVNIEILQHLTNPNSNEYKFTAIGFDIAGHRLFKPVGIKKDEIDKRSFLKLSFEKEDLDTLSEWTHTNNIVRGPVGGANNILVMEERQVLSNLW
jgi:hypothetical protein